MADSRIIQPPVPRAASIRTTLAEIAWQDGLSTFVVDRVPFSFSCGRILAGALSHLVIALAEDAEDVVVMEIGAGIGYLSRNCLDVLSLSDPETYRKSRFIVTDVNPDVVNDVRRRGVLVDHGARAKLAVTDLRDPDSVLAERPRLVILSNVIDTIPPTVLERREDGVYECLVETWLAETAAVYDGSVWPPVRLRANEIADLLADGIDRVTPVLGRRVVKHLQERWSWRQTDAEVVTGSLLNSRKETALALCGLLAGMPDNSGILISDFGYVKSNPSTIEELTSTYGLCAFWAVAFLEIVAIAQSFGFEVMLNPDKEGETQTLLIYKGDRIDRMRSAFSDGFRGSNDDCSGKILNQLGKGASAEQVNAAVKEIEETVAPDDANIYGTLAQIAHLLLSRENLSGAEQYARRCVDLYPEVAAPELAVLGSLAMRRDEMKEAEGYFNQAVDVAPGLANGYFGLGHVYRSQKKWPQYFDAMKRLMARTDCNVVQVMKLIAETLKDTDLRAEAAAAERWLEGGDDK